MVLFTLAAACLGAAVLAADLGLAAWCFGPDYVARLVLWRRPDPVDRQRFPTRVIAAAAAAAPLPRGVAGDEAAIRDAFVRVQGPHWSGPGLERALARTGTTSFLVLRHGRLVFASYLNGHEPSTPQNSFSIAKSVTGLLAGAAIADGLLPAAHAPAEAVLPQVPGLRSSGVTLRHLLDMTAGFALDNRWRFGPLSFPWRANQRMHFSPDLRAVAAAVRPEVPPGTRFVYDDRNAMLVGMALERVTGESPSAYLERRIWRPMGAACPADWLLDSVEKGFEKMESGIGACAEDFVRLGILVLRDGRGPDGAQLLPREWTAALGRPASEPGGFTPRFGAPEEPVREGYGLFWWSVGAGEGPLDVYAYGLFGQVLYVSRARDTVVLRTGDREGGVSWTTLVRNLLSALAGTV